VDESADCADTRWSSVTNIHSDAFPDDLTTTDQWIVWNEEERDSKQTKIPISPVTGSKADSTNPDDWASFDTAYKYYKKNTHIDGIGFVFSSQDLYVGIDLDDCRDPDTGDLDNSTQAIVDQLDSYTEISPSGTGLHIIAQGVKPDGKSRKGDVEMYDESRFFTMTGHHLDGTPDEVKVRKNEIQAVHDEHIAEDTQPTPPSTVGTGSGDNGDLNDEEVIKKARQAANGNQFEQLWHGTTAGYESHSEADLALCSLLAFWTGGDEAQIDRLFRDSSLYRDKWDEQRGGQTYGERTIQKAVQGQTDFYDPSQEKQTLRIGTDTTVEIDPNPTPGPNGSTSDHDNTETGDDTQGEIATVQEVGEWEFKNVLPDDHFVSEYLDLATELTDAYPEYHFMTALSLLSTAVDRKIQINVTPTPLFPNIWTLLLGKSTVSRKSTALDIGETILGFAEMDEKKLPEDFSPEAFIEELEQNPQSLFMKDEFGEFLAKMDRSYQKGIGALLSRIYDCPRNYSRKLRKNTFNVENAYVTMASACVPKQIARHTSVEDLESGFFPRIVVVWPERHKERMDRQNTGQDVYDQQQRLGEWVGGLYHSINYAYQLHGQESGGKQVLRWNLDEEAIEYYNQWCRDWEDFIMESEKGDEFSAFFGRLSDVVLKIACLLEVGSCEFGRLLQKSSQLRTVSIINNIQLNECKDKLHYRDARVSVNNIKDLNGVKALSQYTISLQSVQASIYYATKLFLPNANKLMNFVKSHNEENQVQRVYELAKKHANTDGEIKHSKLLRYSHMKARDFKDCIQTLINANRLDIVNQEPITYVPLEPDGADDMPTIAEPDDLHLGIPAELDLDAADIDPDRDPAEDGSDDHDKSSSSPQTEPDDAQISDEEDLTVSTGDDDDDDDDGDNGAGVPAPVPDSTITTGKEFVEYLAMNNQEPIPIGALIKTLDASETQVEKWIKQALKRGEAFKPRPGHIKHL
jgi:primase-polymerase (primpol)-like protein